MTVRVYQYGLHPPKTNVDLIEQQLRAAHRYRNRLIEIERDRRDRCRQVIAAHGDVEAIAAQIAPLQQRVDELRLAIKAARKSSRLRTEPPELRRECRQILAGLKELRAQQKDIKNRIATDPDVQRQLAEIREQAQGAKRESRKTSGVYWGTYLLVEQAHDLACKSVTPPRFVRWRPDGNLGVLFMNGIALGELWGGNSLMEIDPVPPEAYLGTRGERRRMTRTRVRMRIQSDDKGKPIWSEWDMIMHRPLPEGCRIKNAVISRRRINCTMFRWFLQLTVELPESWTRGQLGQGACALNLGWCVRDNGDVRAGYVVGEDGAEREIVVPQSIIARVEKSQSIRSIRDRNLDEMRPQLVDWIARQPEGGLPEWFTERTRMIHAWRSTARFAALSLAWRQQRWTDDSGGYDLLEAWRYRDQHLEHYESGMRRHALGHRREIYRIAAAELVQQYGTLVVDTTDLRTYQRSPQPESERVEFAAHKRNQRFASGSELRGSLINAFKRAGGTVIEVPSMYITRHCHLCGTDNERKNDVREMTCVGCGVSWDQDANACRNLLLRADDGATTEREVKPLRAERLRNRRSNAESTFSHDH